MESPTFGTDPSFSDSSAHQLACPILALDRQARILYVNPACERLIELPIAELRGRRLWDLLVLPAEITTLTALFCHLQPTRFPLDCEQHWQTASGDHRIIRWTFDAQTDEAGVVRRLIASGRDMTEQRAAEARFRAVWLDAPIGIVLGDLERRVVRCNLAYERLLGYSEAELQTGCFPLATHPDDAARDMALYQQLAAGQRERYEIEKRYVRKDGAIVQAQVTIMLLRDTTGEPSETLGMVEDVTALRAAERGRTEAEHQLTLTEEMLAAKQRQLRRYELGITDHADRVLHLLADTRLTQRQIGDKLHISHETVRDHLRKLADKLGVEARREVVANEARARGLL